MTSLEALLAAAGGGDERARNELFARFLPRVQGLVHRQIERRLRKPGHEALRAFSTSDVVQEVLLEVLAGLEHWQASSEHAFSALLATLVEHRLLDQLRRQQAGRRDIRRRHGSGPETAGVEKARTPLDEAAARERLQLYREVLETFRDRERSLLAMRLEDHGTFAEIAERLDYPSPDAARKAFHDHHARLLLRLRARGLGAEGSGA